MLNLKVYEKLMEELEDLFLGKAAELILENDKERYSLDQINEEFKSC